MDTPTIVMPVAYRSPQHLSFDFNYVKVKNQYTAQIDKCVEGIESASYVQWYNNCNVDLCDLILSSWCGMKLSINEDPKKVPLKSMKQDGIPLNITVKWPSGPLAQLVVPKWDIKFQMSSLR